MGFKIKDKRQKIKEKKGERKDKRSPPWGADRKEISQWLILGRSQIAAEICGGGVWVG
jgi:hypothetical protein